MRGQLVGKLLIGVDMVKGRKQIVSFLGLKPGMKVFLQIIKMKDVKR